MSYNIFYIFMEQLAMFMTKRLKELQGKYGYTTKYICRNLNISIELYRYWIAGHIPRIKHLISLSQFYKITIDELVHGKPYKKAA